MPPKSKGASKANKETDPSSKQPTELPPPRTLNELSALRYARTNPYGKLRDEVGAEGLTDSQRHAVNNCQYLTHPDRAKGLSNKATKELWKQLGEANVPLRSLPKPRHQHWGRHRPGWDVGEHTYDEYRSRTVKQLRLSRLARESERFRDDWWEVLQDRKGRSTRSSTVAQATEITDEQLEQERQRRQEMAALKRDLHGERTNPYALDPEWDDVAPIPQAEPEHALAAIAYPEDYAEAMAYLRAVMASKEHSPRCLELTEHIISMNPAHYTVWLYRFAIVEALNISIPEEMAWLNAVSLEHLKNYQIWHHRQQLLDHYYPAIATSAEDVAGLAASETAFLNKMLAQDTKNYHVWSYRQYLVRKLGMWGDTERQSIEGMIDDDVRNNSAWSHRFFLVFSDPGYTTPGSHATEHDPKIPSEIIDREVEYAKLKAGLAPQNQSPWNYLRGVLVKGGRPLGEAREFAEGFIKELGSEADNKERVRSSHALDLLADIYKEAGDKERADLCLRRLGDKWDRIRKGYWEYRRRAL
ncbi:putative geranylgeranyltransferase type I alpha subunit [Microdochium bolleyi]|uniref:Protein farnesyltransferase/geranylgeranyltransferase type-1 subunit alpha n=1 Tax=Microdochium bolleyi TaxID=196109 RepID=A0A136J7Z8_9PEZI|nr:putative geranylgeranyltransferase type I alpha subunit [Microdochium bolleyi]